MPCVGCPCVSKGLKGQACLAMHFPLLYLHAIQSHSHAHFSKCFPFIDLGRQRRTNTWSLKQRVSSAQQNQTFPVLPCMVKMWVDRGNMYSLDWNTDYSYKQIFGSHSTRIPFRFFIRFRQWLWSLRISWPSPSRWKGKAFLKPLYHRTSNRLLYSHSICRRKIQGSDWLWEQLSD